VLSAQPKSLDAVECAALAGALIGHLARRGELGGVYRGAEMR
jgi:hypothetical protein